MKNLRNIVAVVAVALSVGWFFFPKVQGLAQLPDEGRILVLTVLTAALTYVLLWLSSVTGQDLGGYAAPIAAAIAPIVVTIIESALQRIPPVFDNVVLTIIHLIVLLVGSLGAFALYRQQSPSLR